MTSVAKDVFGRISGRRRTTIDYCLILLALISVLAVGPGAVHAEGTAYRLGTGDRVRIIVFGQEDLSGEFEVGSAGGVSLPLVGEVQAQGLTLKEFEAAVTEALKPDFLKDPSVAVDVLNYRPFYIIGEINNPGSYPYVNGMRVVNAVAMAGGFTYRAQEDNLFIKRSGSEQKTPADQNTLVLPGDVVEVPEKVF